MRLNRKWSTHMPVLMKVVEKTEGPVLELGVGLYSTPFLHWSCKLDGKELVSYDNNPKYFAFFKDYRSSKHIMKFVEDWNTLDVGREWGLAFVDVAPAEARDVLVEKLRPFAKVIVLHDIDSPEYGYSHIVSTFKYNYTYKDESPHTAIVSDFIDVGGFMK